MKRSCVELCFVLMVSALISIFVYISNMIEFKLVFFLIVYLAGVYYALYEIIRRLKKLLKLFLTVEFISVIFGSVVGGMLSLFLFFISIVFILGVGWIFGIYNCIVGMIDAYYLDVFSQRHLQGNYEDGE